MAVNLSTFSLSKKTDFIIGMLFAFATVLLIMVFLNNDVFFQWAFARHHNILSWYIRPLFIVPLVIFAAKKSLTGVFASILALLTSMFWFPAPQESSVEALTFLAYEMDYIKGTWTLAKILWSLLIPLFFIVLIAAAWLRKWMIMVATVFAAMILKVVWSLLFSGKVGITILPPAVLGLIICSIGFYYYIKKGYIKKDR